SANVREGESGPNGNDRPSLGEVGKPEQFDKTALAPEQREALLREWTLSNSEFQQARTERNELVNQGKAWDANGKPTPEFKAADDKLGRHNDAVIERIRDIEAKGVSWDNPTPEYERLKEMQSQNFEDRANYLQKNWARR